VLRLGMDLKSIEFNVRNGTDFNRWIYNGNAIKIKKNWSMKKKQLSFLRSLFVFLFSKHP
jgi:hypothetical protein